jgi:hypothetical protein
MAELIITDISKKCEHGRKKNCKFCGGPQMCAHGERKHRCIECGTSEMCRHSKIKLNCNLCSQICHHGKQKSFCKDCGGASICEHGRRKTTCKMCGGNSVCEHGKQKFQCKFCGGNAICEHGLQRPFCKDCGGNAMCVHGKQKSFCKDCGGNAMCVHGKQKSQCKDCGGSSLCLSSWCHTTGNNKYERYCMPCFVNNPENIHKPAMRNYKTKEKEVVDCIKQTYPQFTWVADRKVQDGCSRRRPDLLLDMGSHIIIVEIDENKHSGYDCSCENKRLMEISQDLQHRPIVFIRFNPDSYVDQNGILVKSCWKLNKLGVMQIIKTRQSAWGERLETLKQHIQYWVDNSTQKTVEIVELFY